MVRTCGIISYCTCKAAYRVRTVAGYEAKVAQQKDEIGRRQVEVDVLQVQQRREPQSTLDHVTLKTANSRSCDSENS